MKIPQKRRTHHEHTLVATLRGPRAHEPLVCCADVRAGRLVGPGLLSPELLLLHGLVWGWSVDAHLAPLHGGADDAGVPGPVLQTVAAEPDHRRRSRMAPKRRPHDAW